MSGIDKHTNNKTELFEGLDFFNKVEVPFESSREEVWDEMFANLEQPSEQRRITPWRKASIAIAAALLILVGLFSALRFYTTTLENPAGQMLAVQLPDGSSVELNASSTLSYYPLWWWAKREVKLSGEAFFKVEKGSRFKVVSTQGSTEVLGTSFNVFARSNIYKVSCVTGKVKVTSGFQEEAVLSPGYQAEVKSNGSIKVVKLEKKNETGGWRNGMFRFTSAPLQYVIEEIERQYDVSIRLNTGQEYFYTGYFTRKKNIDEVLEIVSRPFGLQFEKTSGENYILSEY